MQEAPEFDGQLAHAVAPRPGEYDPAAHGVQAAVTVVALYVPLAHCSHAPPAGPVEPELQTQAASTVLLTGELEYVGVGHAVHAAVPEPILYFPATHPVHGPAFGPVYPALQAQPKDVVQVVHETPEKSGQLVHVDAEVAASAPENFPGPQSVHSALPVAALYFPVKQTVHVPAVSVICPV
jgi:hypothetical protein